MKFHRGNSENHCDNHIKMALCRTGVVVLKSIKPGLINPSYVIPSSVNLQVRHAARKGYREKALRKKKLADVPKTSEVLKEIVKLKRKYSKIEKTCDLKKPEPPNDDVIILNDFNYKKFSLSEAVKFHREYHHPTVYNNPEAFICLKIEINMVGKSKHQVIKPFSGIADVPHPFVVSHKKEVLVLCNPEDKDAALSSGASIAGGVDIVQKIKEGVIQPSLYDYVLAHVNFLSQLTPIRGILKDKLPRAKRGTLTNNLPSAIRKFINGIEYSCVELPSGENFGFIDCTVGPISMELNHLEENLKVILDDIESHRPPREGDFISWVWCASPPSPEEFSLDLSLYLKKSEKVGDDDEDDPFEKSETEVAKQLELEYEEKKIMEKEN